MPQAEASNSPRPKNALVLWALFLLTFTEPSSSAEQAITPPRNFTISASALTELLAQKSVHELFQDSSGFLWIRTQDAVHRFDGYKLRSFPPNEAGLGTLGHGSGPQITQDQHGTIWLATLGRGLVFYDPLQSKFQSAQAPVADRPNQNVSTIYSSPGGAIWLGHLNGEVQRFNPLSALIDRKLLLGDAPGSIAGIVEDSDRRLWVATANGGLFTCKPGQIRCTRFLHQALVQTAASGQSINTLTIDRLDRIWLGTADNGIFLIDALEQEVLHFRHEPADRESISDDAIRRLFLDKQGRMWVGTDKGLNVFLGQGRFARFDSSNSYLGDYNVLGLWQDHTGKFWIGTHFGLYTGTETFFETIDENRGLPSNISTAFSRYRDKNIFVATYDGLYQFNTGTATFSELDIPGFQLRDPRVMSINFIDPYLWIGYRSHGLEAVHVETGATHQLVQAERDFQHGSVSAILHTDDGDTLVATFGDGLYVVSNGSQQVRNYRYSRQGEPGLASNKLFTLAGIGNSEILIGTLNGLSVYATDSSRLKAIRPAGSGPAGSGPAGSGPDGSGPAGSGPDLLDSAQVLAIAEDHAGNIWLGYQNTGLVLWKQQDRAAGRNILTPIATSPPMPSSTIYAIEVDQAGKLWIATTRGLARLDPHTLSIVTFDRSHGLQDDEFNSGASLQDRQGRLYFGGNRGFNRFFPGDVVLQQTPPPLRLTALEVAGKTLPTDVSYVDMGQLHLTHRQRRLNLEFSVLDYTNPAGNRYKYKLENFDRNWVDIGYRHSLSFTNLPPGKFLLRVSGANSDGVWNDDGIRLAINVYPPPWLRWWAFSCYGALLMALIFFSRKFYDTYQKKEQATALAAELHNTAELVMDDLEDQLEMEQQLLLNIHHHLESTLALVSGFLERQAESIDDDVILEAFADNQQRITCLQMIENNMIYTAHLLEVDFYKFLEDLFTQVFPVDIRPGLEIVPINDALNQKLEVDIAIPAALITNELVVNSARHAFETSTGIQTVRVHLQELETRTGWVLEVADSGSGLPLGIDPLNPTTTGMDIIARFNHTLNAKLSIDRSRGSRFTFEIPRSRPDHSGS